MLFGYRDHLSQARLRLTRTSHAPPVPKKMAQVASVISNLTRHIDRCFPAKLSRPEIASSDAELDCLPVDETTALHSRSEKPLWWKIAIAFPISRGHSQWGGNACRAYRVISTSPPAGTRKASGGEYIEALSPPASMFTS